MSAAATPKRTSNPSPVGSQQALDAARYAADMTAQLEAMAAAVDLDLLAYFLGMAKAEAELFLRLSPQGPEKAEPRDGDGHESREPGSDRSAD